MKNNFKEISFLIQNKKFSEAISFLNNLSDDKKKYPNYYFLKGISYLYLGEFDQAIDSLNSAIKMNNNDSSFYFYRGYTFSKLYKFDKTEKDYLTAISLKPHSAELYNNLAGINYTTGENEKSIQNYLHSIELNKNLKQSLLGLVHVLSQTKTSNMNSSEIIATHNSIKKISLTYSPDKFIEDEQIKELLEKTNLIIENNISDIELDIVQTYREQKVPPKCNRHKKIFKSESIIPKHCFGCYKIQVDVSNVIELIKLFIVFDKIKLQAGNYRKCMIELRSGIKGNYKGLIFCNSIEESELILKNLESVLQKNFNKNLICKIKRGCSEYYEKYPDYNRLDEKALNYNSNWESYEKKFDEKNPDLIFDKKPSPTLEGLSLFDVLAFRNWLAFAKLIGDESYKTVSSKIYYSKYIEDKIRIKQKIN